MAKKKVLVVDDDRTLLKVVKAYLETREFAVVVADNGSEGLMLVREFKPDVILLDANMPGLRGHSVCRMLKKEADTSSIPVIIISGEMMNEQDILAGFEGGADDYVMKPLSMPVLEARILAVLRRYGATAKMESKLRKFGIELDPSGRTVKSNGKSVSLTRKEFDLLATLMSNPGRALAVRYLLETVWGYDPADYNDPGTVEVHISHLRKKLGPRIARRIVNVTGHGYKFDA